MHKTVVKFPSFKPSSEQTGLIAENGWDILKPRAKAEEKPAAAPKPK